jgi:parallel beta-helix repeat protein
MNTSRMGLAAASCLLALAWLGRMPGGMAQARPPGATSVDSYLAYLPTVAKARPFEERQGDWVVRGEEVVQDVRVLLTGNLIVKGGASLTLRNARLAMNSGYDGEYGISVEPGGSLAVHETAITAAPGQHRYYFTARGDAFVMANSELHGCGWGDVYPPPERADPRGLVLKTDGAVLNGNLISGNYIGAVLVGQRIQVTGNTFQSNDRSVLSVLSSDNHITDNVFQHASEDDSLMLTLARGSHGNVLTDNTFLGECLQEWECTIGVAAHYSWGNWITRNRMDVDSSISLSDGCCNNHILNNTLINRELNVNIHGGANNRIEGNRMHLSGDGVRFGILLTYVHDTIVAGNTITAVGEDGRSLGDYGVLYLDHSTGNSILNNRISGSVDRAVFLTASKENTIASNRASDSWQGIFLFHQSSANSVSGNAITATAASIVVDDSPGNLICGNHFSDVWGQAYDNGDNEWDHQGRGNYWTLYQGQDADSDGIGDTPYLVPPNGLDRYPLIAPPAVIDAPVPSLDPISFEDGPLNSDRYRVNVTGEQIIENQHRVIETGQFVVYPGGTLIIRNCTWLLGSKGPVEIEVVDGGSLRIENSVLRSAEDGYGFSASAGDQCTFVMLDSQLEGVSRNLGDGLYLCGARSATIENSTISGSHTGMYLGHLSSARISNNTFVGNGQSVFVDTCDKVTIEGNTVHNAVWRAIGVMGWQDVHNVRVSGNEVLSSWGDGISVPENTVVASNKVSYCKGIGLSVWRHGNTAAGNTVSGCGGGISVHGNGNLLYHNNLLYNGVQAEDDGNNQWDDGSEGNFWSDYTGPDMDGNGIGDVPYAIQPNGWDRYPLMMSYELGRPMAADHQWLPASSDAAEPDG